MVIKYARITFHKTPGIPNKPFFLRITRETEFRVSDVEGDAIVKNVGGKRVDETQHFIDRPCIAKMVPYKMSNMYARLVKA